MDVLREKKSLTHRSLPVDLNGLELYSKTRKDRMPIDDQIYK